MSMSSTAILAALAAVAIPAKKGCTQGEIDDPLQVFLLPLFMVKVKINLSDLASDFCLAPALRRDHGALE